MTKEETVQIMAMLGAFYSGGKNDPKMQATAWYLVLGKYDYRVATKAVLNFAETDTREYATFPTVGKIVAEIKRTMAEERKPISEILYSISYGKDYDQLSAHARLLISRKAYNEYLQMDAEEFSSHMREVHDALMNRQLKMLGDGNGED